VTQPSAYSPSAGRIGPYEIIGLLGQGGMAAVYEAKDTRNGQVVAVKVLSRLRPSWVRRFDREFDAARRVDHPNVVRVLESGEHEGVAYFSMERVGGRTASRWVLDLDDDDPMPPLPPTSSRVAPLPIDPQILERVIDVAIQLCRAVGAIHRVGLVHRDLKPGNVLVTSDGTVKLVDFGVAKWLEEQTSFTQVGHVVGSYSYMSPEQITGSEVDHRADLYGLGILLYELLSGAPPFRARRPQEFLWLHCTAAPEPLSRRLDGVPPELDGLLLRLLAKEPADRPESMRAVEHELIGIRALVEGEAAGASLEFLPPDDVIASSAGVVFEDADTGPADGSLDEPTVRSKDGNFQTLRERLRKERDERDARAGLASGRRIPTSGTHRVVGASSMALAALVTPRHVGRKTELDALIAHVKGARRRGVRAILVEGEEGIGKTRLLHTFRGLAWVKGARVAIGRCHPSSGAFCAPFHDILLRLAGPGLARSHVDRVLGGDRELLTRFFPALGTRGALPGVGPGLGAALEDQSAAFRAVGELLRRVSSDAPLVIGMEDAHFADEGTLRLVSTLLTRLGPPTPAQLVIVLTYRGEELSQNARPAEALDQLKRRDNVHEIRLRPLSSDEIGEVIRSVTVDVPVGPKVVARLSELSRGNPQFAVEVARTIVENGGAADGENWELPASLLAAYERRLAILNKPARDVARIIAVLGEAPPMSIVLAASGLDPDAFNGALDELERRRVVQLDTRSPDEPLTLYSEALRSAVLDGLSRAQARSLHRRAATTWLKLGSEHPGAAAQAARHLYAAGEDRAAFPHALEAAFLAARALDYASAARWMSRLGSASERLKEVSPEAVFRYQVVRFLLAFGEGDLRSAETAIAKAGEVAPNTRARLDTAVFCARLHTRTGNYLSAVQLCRRGLREARAAGFADLSVLFATHGARAARRSGDYRSALAWLSEADRHLAEHPELEALAVRAAWSRSAVLLELQRADEAEPAIHQAIDLAKRTNQERAEAGLRVNLSVLYWRRGDVRAAVHEVEAATRIFESLEERDQAGISQANLAELRLLQGRLDDAQTLAARSWSTFRRLRDQTGVLVSAAVMVAVATAVGDTVEGEAVIATVGDGPRDGTPMEAHWLHYWLERSRWHRAAAQPDAARYSLDQAEKSLGASPADFRRRDVDLLRAELLLDAGDAAGAEALLGTVEAGAEAEGHLPVLWWARAVRTAASAITGSSAGRDVAPDAPPEELVGEHIPLALATFWYHARSHQTAARAMTAKLTAREGLALAQEHGYKQWIRRFKALPGCTDL
jgi:serine/threonine protein kinase/tetratricopeptide (TPR) repeat protein